MNNTNENIIKKLRLNIWYKYFNTKTKGICSCCEIGEINNSNFNIGHIIPISKGGTDGIENLIPICHNCYPNIGDYTIEEYKKLFM